MEDKETGRRGEVFVMLAAARAGRFWSSSTRVDIIPSRRRTPLGDRLPLPPTAVLSLPLDLVDRHPYGFEGVLGELLYATPPGWAWEIADPEESRADAIACARHQATRRGDDFTVLEAGVGLAQPLVAILPGGSRHLRSVGRRSARQMVLVVVQFLPAF